jgi:outer membrane protein OmpA-like peptidoglycan-associated protein
MRAHPHAALVASVAVIGAGATAVHADTWLSAEVPAAIAVSSPQDDNFSAGAMPSLGLYVDLMPYLAVAARARYGVLTDGDSPGAGFMDPGTGGLGHAGPAIRLHGDGPWLEGLVGGGKTGGDWVPVVEAGVGWQFDLGAVALGPSVRYLRVFHDDSGIDQGSADLILFGVELTAGLSKKRPAPRVAIVADADQVVDQDRKCPAEGGEGCPSPIVDRDGDGILDKDDKCIDDPETVNGVDDQDGCPDEGLFVVENDRIVLEERVLFELNRARVRKTGVTVIKAIANAWNQHPTWDKMIVEGHADIRGDAKYNQWLSETRSARVREALVEAGIPADRIESTGYGATRLRDEGTTEEAHQRNRRVEFVIVRGSSRVRTDTLPTTPAAPAPGTAPAPIAPTGSGAPAAPPAQPPTAAPRSPAGGTP